MRVEIYCAHPWAKRGLYDSGWLCEPTKGGCGTTGVGEISHGSRIIAYAEFNCNCKGPDEGGK